MEHEHDPRGVLDDAPYGMAGQAMADARRSTAPHAPMETQLEMLERKVAMLTEIARVQSRVNREMLALVQDLVARG